MKPTYKEKARKYRVELGSVAVNPPHETFNRFRGPLTWRSAGCFSHTPVLLLTLLAVILFSGCSLLRDRDEKPIYLRESILPASSVSASMAEAREIALAVEGQAGQLPPNLWIRRTDDPAYYAYTRLLYGDGGQFLGAEVFLREDDALTHELIHVRRRNNYHDPRYKGKVKYW